MSNEKEKESISVPESIGVIAEAALEVLSIATDTAGSCGEVVLDIISSIDIDC